MYSRYWKHEKRAPPSSTKVARAQRRGSHEGGPAGFAFGWFTVATFDYHEVLLFGIQLLYHYALPDATCYSMLFFYLNYHHWSSLNLNENNYKNGSTFGMTITWIFLTLLPISCPHHPFHIWGSRQDLDDLQAMLHSLGQPGNLTKAPREKVLPWLIPVFQIGFFGSRYPKVPHLIMLGLRINGYKMI